MSKKTVLKYLRKAFKITAWSVGSFVLLFLLIVILLQFSGVQTWIIQKITHQISERTQTRVEIDRVAIRFPKTIGLKGIYVEDTRQDTLLYAQSIFVDVRMLGLLSQKVDVNTLELNGVVANMKREQPDTVYNFQFLADAFSSDEEVEKTPDPDKEKNEWSIGVRKIALNHIRYHLKDHTSGIDLRVSLDQLTTNLRDADLLNQKYHTRDLTLKKPVVALHMQPGTYQEPQDTTDDGIPELDIHVKSLHIHDLDFAFESEEGSSMHVQSQTLSLIPEYIGLHRNHLELQSLQMNQLKADLAFPETSQDSVAIAEKMQVQDTTAFSFHFADILDWHIQLQNLDITHSSFKMQQGASPQTPEVFNPSHLNLEEIQIALRDLYVAPHKLQAGLENISLSFSELFRLEKLSGQLWLDTQTRIQDLTIKTTQSLVGLTMNSNGSFLDFSQEDIQNYHVDIHFAESNLQKDLAYFAPAMSHYYFNWPGNQGIKLEGGFKGSMDDIYVDSLRVTAPDFFTTFLQGHIAGLPNLDSLQVDIPALRLFAAPQKFLTHLHDSLHPQGVTLPEFIFLSSVAHGTSQELHTQTDIRTSMGNFSLEGFWESKDKELPSFTGLLAGNSVELGKMIQQSSQIPVPLSFELNLQGEGSKAQNMNLEARLWIENLIFNDHPYHDLLLYLDLKDSIASLHTAYEDSKISFDLMASYGLFLNEPTVQSILDLRFAYLKALGFTDDDLLIKTYLTTDILLDDYDFFSGEIQIRNTSIASEGEIFNLPDISVLSTSAFQAYDLTLTSELAEARFEGNFSPAHIPMVLTRHFSRYYDLPFYDSGNDQDHTRKFNMHLHVRPEEIITHVLIDAMQSYDTLSMEITFDEQQRKLTLEADWPYLQYGSMELTKLQASVFSDAVHLDMDIIFEQLSLQDITLHHFDFSGRFTDHLLAFQVSLKDFEQEPLYGLRGNLKIADTLYQLHIDDEKLLLNAEQWHIPNNNLISLAPGYLHVQNFSIESQGRKLAIASRETHDDHPSALDISLQQIDLGRLTDISSATYPLIGGIFNGEVSLLDIFERPVFLADLQIKEFSYQGDTLGDFYIMAQNPQDNLIDLEVSLQSPYTDLVIAGQYFTGDTPGMDIRMNLQRLDLPSFEGFAQGQLTHLQGFLSGEVHLQGTPAEPEITGELQINETSFRVTALNAGYFLKSERIVFNRQQVNLQNIALEDSSGRQARINGNVNFADISQLAFHLDLNSRNFMLMNVRAGQNDMYHGRILIDTDLRLRGSQNDPVIDGRIKLNEGSRFTFVVPQTAPEAIGDEGVVEFVQLGDTLFYQLARETLTETQMTSSFERLDLSVNIEVDRQTDIRVIIDELAGDFLEVKGGGLLSFGIDPGGRVSLSGRYEIGEGEYLLTFYDVIRRSFRIRSGSHISWTGDPLNADVNITAIYTIRTNAQELMAGQIPGDQAQSTRQQYPFRVYLNMRGNLMEPEISFELDLPPEHQNAMDGAIMGRLNQINQNESELNKQVFALLLLGSFIQENPFASLAGSDLASTARSSGSQILSQQLNRLSDRYVRGVDIHFEVESFVDFAEGQPTGRTELQMEVSRNFFDERVRVTVGGNIELEDETRREKQAGDIAGDFSIEYLLTPEGNIRLKGFRTKNYADVFDGEVVETGVSLIFSRSYNRFRDLFRKKEDDDILPRDTENQRDAEQLPDHDTENSLHK